VITAGVVTSRRQHLSSRRIRGTESNVKHLFATVFGNRRSAERRGSLSTFRPEAEALEDRCLLAFAVLNNGVLTVAGGALGDTLTVQQVANRVSVGGIKINLGTATGPSVSSVSATDVQRIRFFGHEGDDSITNLTAIPSEAYGGTGRDTMVGGSAADYLDTGEGEDVASGNGGHDTLFAGPHGVEDGFNILNGDAGNDWLFGTEGDDELHGGSGNDLMGGFGGDDVLDGGSDNDALVGGVGDDTLVGGFGNDSLIGEGGRDQLFGNDGDDDLNGGDDGVADHLEGGAGRDRFQMDQVLSLPGTPTGPNGNHDHPVDFNSAEDVFYGSDILRPIPRPRFPRKR
jgi:Ca2+-binding RTX toxin-like protein